MWTLLPKKHCSDSLSGHDSNSQPFNWEADAIPRNCCKVLSSSAFMSGTQVHGKVHACHIPSLHCTVFGFTLDWESDKSLRHDRERHTEPLERAFLIMSSSANPTSRGTFGIHNNKGFGQEKVWMICVKSWATFTVLVWCDKYHSETG